MSLSRDLLPAVAHPRSPAAGFAKGNKKGSSSKLGCLSISFCGERGIRTPGTVIPYGSLANCWFQPLTHLTLTEIVLPAIADSLRPRKQDDKVKSNLGICQINFNDCGLSLQKTYCLAIFSLMSVSAWIFFMR